MQALWLVLVEDVLLTTNEHTYLVLEGVEADVLLHHQWGWLAQLEEQIGVAHQNAITAQLKFVIIVFNGKINIY